MGLDSSDMKRIKRELDDLKQDILREIPNQSETHRMADNIQKIENLVDTEIKTIQSLVLQLRQDLSEIRAKLRI